MTNKKQSMLITLIMDFLEGRVTLESMISVLIFYIVIRVVELGDSGTGRLLILLIIILIISFLTVLIAKRADNRKMKSMEMTTINFKEVIDRLKSIIEANEGKISQFSKTIREQQSYISNLKDNLKLVSRNVADQKEKPKEI
jgi:peptidoglycan hydrolase CwlO-like protein